MKKNVLAGIILVVLSLFATSGLIAEDQIKNPSANKNFSEFTLDGDLSWLEGIWKLTSWVTDNHGKMEDSSRIFGYQYLLINGTQKDSRLIEESKSARTCEVSKYEYTVESYLLMNSHAKGNKNMVNAKKSQLLLVREFARDSEIIFYYTFEKQKSYNPYDDVASFVREEVIGGTRETIHINHKLLVSNLKDMEASLKESSPVTGSNNLEKFSQKAENITKTYAEHEKLEYAQYNKIYLNYQECLKYWKKEQKLLEKNK